MVRQFIKRNFLLIIVFLTGAAVLVLEVTAIRILSPYYGNTIYSYSSVLSVILAALSFGYYLGGRLSDKHSQFTWFYGIIFFSGISVFVLLILKVYLLPIVGYRFSNTHGPLLFSMLLFFIPSFFLGCLSPYAIRLQKDIRKKEGIGQLAGEIFFWSTSGSIVGSLLTGFILIPRLGINSIIVSAAILLCSISLVGFTVERFNKRLMRVAIIIMSVGIAISITPSFLDQNSSIVYNQDGVYEHLLIYDGKRNGKPTRFFQQDRSSSSAMFLDSDGLVYDYTKYYALYKVFTPSIKRALFIGGGAYSMPKALLGDEPQVFIDVAEIEPALFELSKKYFRVKDNPRLSTYIKDGRRFLVDSTNNYDFIFSDVYYSLYSIPSHFTTIEFFQLVYNKLNEGGIFLANLPGVLPYSERSFLVSEIKTLREVFPNSYLFAVIAPESPTLQNFIFVGLKNDKKIDFGDKVFLENEDSFIRALHKHLVDESLLDFQNQLVLTDDYAPVEALIAGYITAASRKAY